MTVAMKNALKLVACVVAVATLALVAGVAWIGFAPRRVPSGQPPLTTLGADSLTAFRSAFNSSEGEVRVLAMLSPT